MTEQDVFVLADQTLCDVVGRIADDQWDMLIPDWFQKGRAQGDITLRTIIGYHAFDEAWVPDVLAGRTKEEVGDRYDGDLLGGAPRERFAEWTARGIAAAKALDDVDRTVHLSYGDFPASEYLKHVTSFRGFRAYDIAKLIGATTTLPAALVEGMAELITPSVEEWRAIGVYPAEVPAPEGADAQTRLLCLVGRQP
jgi:hypothetical protein